MANLSFLAAETLVNAASVVVSNGASVSNLSANGSTVSVTVGGTVIPNSFGSTTLFGGVKVDVYAGNIGLPANDTLIVSSTISPKDLANTNGVWVADFLLTLRGNAKAGGAQSNTVWTGLSTNPGAYNSITPAANAAVNANILSGTANTCLITVAVSGPAGPANVQVQTCAVAVLGTLAP